MISSLQFSPQSLKFLKKSDSFLVERINKRINSLLVDPFPSDSQRVEGQSDKVFRVRVGDFRILYTVKYEIDELNIVRINKRDRVYD